MAVASLAMHSVPDSSTCRFTSDKQVLQISDTLSDSKQSIPPVVDGDVHRFYVEERRRQLNTEAEYR